MATKFKKGEAVKVNATIPQGPVLALRMSEDGIFYYLIEWTDAAGKKQQRWFEEADLVAA